MVTFDNRKEMPDVRLPGEFRGEYMRPGSQEPSRFRVRSYLKAFALHWGQPAQTFCYLLFSHKKAALNFLYPMQYCFESTEADDGPVKWFL